MVGERLRAARQARHLSLTTVATRAGISAATLSRIENEKQALDVERLVKLARILETSPENLVSKGNGRLSLSERELPDQIAALTPQDRIRLWRDLATSRKKHRSVRNEHLDMNARIEELLAQVEFLREEIESVRARLKKRG